MRIVLDTNCLLQIVPRSAKHRWLFDLIKRGDIDLAITSEILFEYEEQLADFYAPVAADGVLQILDTLENIFPVQVFFKWNLITTDPDDNKFSDCAVAAGADYLVTYDRHFRILTDIEFPKIICVTLEELKTIAESQTDS
ncbi:MAG: putative toxin-antitoxin system toxin component, PIN family [Lewinellaceae bacterium]|nr:putative toxin-antitoxin system toxin component, PIN family [Lewinellaceae bacterium]